MSGRTHRWLPGALVVWMACAVASCQVFVVGEGTATADLKTDYHAPAPIDLTDRPPLNELGRRSLVRGLEAEQGFAHIALPLGTTLTLHANGELKPGPDKYRQTVYEKGVAANPGERVAITKLDIKGNEIILDLNGGPYLPHRFLRHVELDDNNVVNPGASDQPTGTRLTLVFDKFIPDVTSDEVKALILGVIDFNAKSGQKAYADTLPPKVRDAVKAHEALVGMDRAMVLAALGQPRSKVREHDDAGKSYEEWIYGQPPQTVHFVRFIGDRVTMIKVATRGEPMVVRDKDETGGEVPAVDTATVAYGDQQPGDGSGAHKAPTLRKPGDPDLPGEMKQVQVQTGGSNGSDGSQTGSAPAKGSATDASKPTQ